MSNKYINKLKIYKKYEEDIWGFFASKEELFIDYIDQLILNHNNFNKISDLKYSKFWFLLHMNWEENEKDRMLEIIQEVEVEKPTETDIEQQEKENIQPEIPLEIDYSKFEETPPMPLITDSNNDKEELNNNNLNIDSLEIINNPELHLTDKINISTTTDINENNQENLIKVNHLDKPLEETNNIHNTVHDKNPVMNTEIKTKTIEEELETFEPVETIEDENSAIKHFVISLFNNLNRKKQKKTIYGFDLENKQKLKAYYSNLKKKHLKKICLKSQKLIGNIYNNLAFYLERRIDAILLRSNLFASVYNIRQFINHNNVFVNFKLINSQNYELKIGDFISIHKNSKNLLQTNFINKLYTKQIFINYPLYLEVDYKLCFIGLIAKPIWKYIPYKISIEPSNILSFNLK